MNSIQEQKKFIIEFLISGERRTKVPRRQFDKRFVKDETTAYYTFMAYEELFKEGFVSRDLIPLGYEYFMTPLNKLRLKTAEIHRDFDFDKPKEV